MKLKLTNYQVYNHGPNGVRTVWLKDAPKDLSLDTIVSKLKEIFTDTFPEWEINKDVEIPHKSYLGVLNWPNL